VESGWRSLPRSFKREYDDLLIELVVQFPSEQRLILPTRFGNAIRAFEDYSRQVYGADGIPLWIHLKLILIPPRATPCYVVTVSDKVPLFLSQVVAGT
jgi:hypothetical protein